jgi:hypothetical protein
MDFNTDTEKLRDWNLTVIIKVDAGSGLSWKVFQIDRLLSNGSD